MIFDNKNNIFIFFIDIDYKIGNDWKTKITKNILINESNILTPFIVMNLLHISL